MRNLDKGVAFGAMFEDSEDLMHQKNEYITKTIIQRNKYLFRSNLFTMCGGINNDKSIY